LSVNLLLPMALLAATTPRMREQVKSGRAPGRIVNIVSSAGLFGNFGQSAYAASKAGLVGLTRVVAMDLARSGITCNAVAPFAATRVTESIQAANEAQAQYKQRALSLSPKHVALLVAALCEDGNRASGQLFGVRGREVFMFSQPRPVMREVLPAIEAERPQRIHKLLNDEWRSAFVDLSTDLEYFNTEPIV
jgi:NAD(P)-dependent dehydrogenase (short-subunit alcohol dehydrogenase family)